MLLLVPSIALAQPDTIPVLLQQEPLWHTLAIAQIAARGVDSIVVASSSPTAGVWLSTDRGRTFSRRDSTVAFPGYICIPMGKPAGQASYGPIWQIDSASAPEFSTDEGLTWNYPASPQRPAKGSLTADGVSTVGDLFWYSTSQHVVLTRTFGLTWDTLPFTANLPVWYDAEHAVRTFGSTRVGSKLIARTRDGGITWDTVVLPGLITSAVLYPRPNILYVAAPYPIIVNYVSLDTGHTWTTMNAFNNIQFVRDSLWYASSWKESTPYLRSTDQGKTWKGFSFPCPNGPTYLFFADSEHGVSLGTSQTDDGGYTWDCLDTTVYAATANDVIPADFDAASYYDLAQTHGSNYVCVSTDRGSTWAALFPYPTNVPSSYGAPTWGVSLGYRLFIAFPDKVIWTGNSGVSFDTLYFNYPGSAVGYIQRTPDGTLWASNDLELYISRDRGDTWTDQSQNIPYRQDSFQLSYTVKPVDSILGFVRTSSGAVFRTTDAGLTWQPDSIMPSLVLDGRHWFAATKYTSDGGATWKKISNPVTVAVDTLRWITSSGYTTDAGSTWHPIPMGAPKMQFTPVDSGTAFAGGFPNGSFWRLDLPFYGKPSPVLNFSVDNQIWQDVPFPKDTGWVQLPVVVHNTAVGIPLPVTFDSVSDPAHFSLAPYQASTVTVPARASVLGPDGLDSVWFVYHPTGAEQDSAKAYWHSSLVHNADGSIARRTDSLDGSATSASVSGSSVNPVDVRVTPNPATGIVTVQGSTGRIILLNVLGEMVLAVGARATESGSLSLDVSKLPAGTYFARIETAFGPVMRKIVKE